MGKLGELGETGHLLLKILLKQRNFQNPTFRLCERPDCVCEFGPTVKLSWKVNPKANAELSSNYKPNIKIALPKTICKRAQSFTPASGSSLFF